MICSDDTGFAGPRNVAAGLIVTALLALVLVMPSISFAAEAPLSPPEPAILRVIFEENDATLPAAARTDLTALAADFQRRSGRLQLKAYAGPPHDASSTARRLALKRALAVRQTLIGEGILAERIFVRAIGGTNDMGPQDRVDIVLLGGGTAPRH